MLLRDPLLEGAERTKNIHDRQRLGSGLCRHMQLDRNPTPPEFSIFNFFLIARQKQDRDSVLMLPSLTCMFHHRNCPFWTRWHKDACLLGTQWYPQQQRYGVAYTVWVDVSGGTTWYIIEMGRTRLWEHPHWPMYQFTVEHGRAQIGVVS